MLYCQWNNLTLGIIIHVAVTVKRTTCTLNTVVIIALKQLYEGERFLSAKTEMFINTPTAYTAQ